MLRVSNAQSVASDIPVSLNNIVKSIAWVIYFLLLRSVIIDLTISWLGTVVGTTHLSHLILERMSFHHFCYLAQACLEGTKEKALYSSTWTIGIPFMSSTSFMCSHCWISIRKSTFGENLISILDYLFYREFTEELQNSIRIQNQINHNFKI